MGFQNSTVCLHPGFLRGPLAFVMRPPGPDRTGLALQAVGIPWRRPVTVVFDAVIAVGITSYALFLPDFLETLSNILELTVTFLGPSLAIYGVDICVSTPASMSARSPALWTARTSPHWPAQRSPP